MVRISTIWDKVDDETTEKVFMVRGDESYARSTNVLFDLKSSFSKASNGYVLTAIVDVLRDVGDSYLTFYDGEEELYVHEWSSNENSQEIVLPRLSWDVLHDLYVVYEGNSQCLRSKSKNIEISKANPDLTDTTITNNSSVTVYDSTKSVTGNVKLNRVSGSASLNAREIAWYLDDVQVGTSNTNSSGNATYTFGRLSNGIHRLSAVFDGYDPLGASSLNWEIAVGYVVTIESYPSIFVNGQSNTVKVSVKDRFGNAKSGANVSFNSKSATTSSNGVATITTNSIVNGNNYTATYGSYVSNSIKANAVTISSITMSSDDGIVGMNSSEKITVSLNGSNIQKGIPVSIDGLGSFTTNASGIITAYYEGDGSGAKTFTATVGGKSSSITITDYMAYWDIPSLVINGDYKKYKDSVSKTNNGIKLAPSKNGEPCGIQLPNIYFSNSDNYEIEFEITVASSTSNNGIGLLFVGSDEIPQGNIMLNQTFERGDIVKFRVEDGNVVYILNDDEIISYNQYEGRPLIVYVNIPQANPEISIGTPSNQYFRTPNPFIVINYLKVRYI